jgi:hypothetical protein
MAIMVLENQVTLACSKRICRARSKGESIHPNIYDANPGVPTASIDFAINGQNKSIAWTLGQPSDPVLSAVSVFDSRTANVHVDQTNDIAYTPLPLKILAALAQASQEIKNRLTAEITAIQKQTPEAIRKPACQAGTGVGKLIAGLSGATQPDTVETLAALTDADRAHLDKLNGDLALLLSITVGVRRVSRISILSGFDFEVGKSDATTGIGEPILFASPGELELPFLGNLAREFDFACAAVANPAGVIDLDPVGLRQFEKGYGFIGVGGQTGLAEADFVTRLRQNQ